MAKECRTGGHCPSGEQTLVSRRKSLRDAHNSGKSPDGVAYKLEAFVRFG